MLPSYFSLVNLLRSKAVGKAFISQSVSVLKHPKIQYCASSVMACCYHSPPFRRTSAAVTCRWQGDSFLCTTPFPGMVGGVGKGRNITTAFRTPDGLCSKQEWCFLYKMETNTQLQEKSLSFLQLPTMFSLDKHFNPVMFCKWPMTVFFLRCLKTLKNYIQNLYIKSNTELCNKPL